MVVIPFVKMSAVTLFVLPSRASRAQDYPEDIRLSCRRLLIIANPCCRTFAFADLFERGEKSESKEQFSLVRSAVRFFSVFGEFVSL